jgi:protein gp37
MADTPRHTYQLLTKRPKRPKRVKRIASQLPWPSNVWMGVSVENMDFAWRADELRQVPAAVRFVSAEPLLGSLPTLNLDGIDWLIAGGESGPAFRPVQEASAAAISVQRDSWWTVRMRASFVIFRAELSELSGTARF